MSRATAVAHKLSGTTGAVGALALGRLPAHGRGAAVLCYHDVGPDPDNSTDYFVSARRLRRQLQAIAGWGLQFVDLRELVDLLEVGVSLDGLVAVTFDDALAGVRGHALEVLAELRVPATVFVVTDVRGVDPPFWPGAGRTLRTDELQELRAAGIRLGSHTCTHPSLTELDDDGLRDELERSRHDLETLTGGDCDLLAYPSGHHDERVERAAEAAGYRAAFTFSFGRVTATSDRYALPRFCMGPGHHRARLAYQLSRPPSAW
jgi:peptidoglycan/xylan/chitin deacetylase (PgdA/CDA1 family)